MAETETGTFDMDSAVSEIASGLELEKSDDVTEEPEITEEETAPAVTEPTETVPVRSAPKAWPKEMHDHWTKVHPTVQEYLEKREQQMVEGLDQYKGDAGYGKQMREVITPYNAMLQAQGVDGPKAVQYLLNAHYKLSNSQPQDKQKYFTQLAKSYGIDLSTLTPSEAVQVDPNVKAVQDRLEKLETSLTTREQAALTEARSRVAKDVESFASDPTHPYFDEVADDIVAMIHAGAELKDAYEKAVWANPVTRAKEMARIQTENETKLRENARLDALKARKASSPNVRGRDTNKAPTEPLGKMEDTMRETLKEIKSRTH
jgi:hypothetical protein